MCRQDAPEKGITPTASPFFNFVTGLRPCCEVTEMRKTRKICWEVKVPRECGVECVWVDWGFLDWTFPMNPSATLTAALRRCGWKDRGWGEAGEMFPNTRGSCSFGGMEGFKERRGEHSFKALWRLAAVGRAAVFPKSPPNRKTVSFFFHCTRATTTPQPKARTHFELTGEKKPTNHFIKCLEYSRSCVHCP